MDENGVARVGGSVHEGGGGAAGEGADGEGEEVEGGGREPIGLLEDFERVQVRVLLSMRGTLCDRHSMSLAVSFSLMPALALYLLTPHHTNPSVLASVEPHFPALIIQHLLTLIQHPLTESESPES